MSKSPKEQQPLSWQQNVVLYVHDLVYLLAAVVLVLTILFRVVVVSGPSMKMTLLDGDYLLLVSNLFYKTPKQGDVVVVSKKAFENGKPIVKRVIAVEGQLVDIDFENGVVFVDGQALDEPYTNTPTNLEEGARFPQTVAKGCVFVMGDNRNNSRDSRYPEIGQIDSRELLGKVLYLVFPGTEGNHYSRDFDRMGAVR